MYLCLINKSAPLTATQTSCS